jgi:hypothetical protein
MYDPISKELFTRGLKPPGSTADIPRPWVPMEPTGIVLDVLKQLANFNFPGKKHVTVAEDMDSEHFSVAVVHERDNYNRRLGNVIARGRLVKELREAGLV